MAVEPLTPIPATPVRSRTGMIRVGIAMMLGTVAYILPFSAGSAILLPARIADTNPDDKVQLLALLTAVAAIVAMVSAVIFGTLSDHTRTRFGARSPWIIGGAVLTALLLIPASFADSFGWLALWWCLAIAALNATGASVAAILPDRVPHHRRATVAALIGIGLLLGTAVGTVVASLFVENITLGFQVAGVLFVVLAVATVLIAPDFSNRDATRERIRISEVAASLRFPRQAHDFYLVLWGRLPLDPAEPGRTRRRQVEVTGDRALAELVRTG